MASNFDINTLYKQGKSAQLGAALFIVAIILVIGYVVFYKDQWDQLKAAEQKEQELKTQYSTKALQAASLPILKEELNQIRVAFNVLLKQLPTDAEIPNLIQELHQAGAKNSLRMDSVKPLAPVDYENVQKLPYEIATSGNYEQIAQFVRDIGRLSRIVTLDQITLTPSDEKNNSGLLTLKANANTYKALEITEAAASAASAAPAPAPAQ